MTTKGRIALIFLLFIVVFIAGFALHNLLTAESRLKQLSKEAYATELNTINKKLESYGFKKEQPRQYCNNIDGDRSVFKNCYYQTVSKIQTSEKVINDWRLEADEFTAKLDNSKWTRLPNLDPVTNNPVNSLGRLLEHKGTYPANVTYEKALDKATCQISFEIKPTDTNQNTKASVEITEACNSIDERWL